MKFNCFIICLIFCLCGLFNVKAQTTDTTKKELVVTVVPDTSKKEDKKVVKKVDKKVVKKSTIKSDKEERIEALRKKIKQAQSDITKYNYEIRKLKAEIKRDRYMKYNKPEKKDHDKDDKYRKDNMEDIKKEMQDLKKEIKELKQELKKK